MSPGSTGSGTSAVADSAPTTSPVVTTAAPTTTPTAFQPLLQTTACADPPDANTSCSVLTVAADRQANDGRTVELPVIVLRATNQPSRSAVVIPGGGPGFAATTDAGYWATHALRTDHDIVLYDQRGTGGSTPSLECTERDDEVIKALQSAEPPPNDGGAIAEAALVCKARLEASGIVMADYDTAASADDLDELRVALGYDRWTILGISYGSRLALESMRAHPAGLRSVILDSVYDVTSGGLAAQIASGERAIGVLTAANPGLDVALDTTLTRWNTTPWEGDVDLGTGTGAQHFVITGDDMFGGLFAALYDRSLIPLLPGVIQGLAGGDGSVVPELLRRSVGTLTGAADAMQLSVDCADNSGLHTDAADDALRAEAGRMSLVAALAGPSCLDWDVPATSAAFNEPVVSDIPALVLAGEYDPITPPDGTKAVAGRLSRSTFVFFHGFGHGVTGDDPCATTIETAFLADPTASLDTSCAP